MTVLAAPEVTLTETREPFVGPGPFEESQEWLFFGRANEIEDVISLVWAHPIVLLYAPSGSGKSSLLNAGAVPTLRRLNVDVLPVVRVRPEIVTDAFVHLENKYIAAALSSLAPRLPLDPRRSNGHRAGSPARFAEAVQLIERGTDERGTRLVQLLIFDQFEELLVPFTTDRSNKTYLDHQRDFFTQVAEALDQDQRLRTVFAIREDYLGEIERLGLELPRGFRTRYRLDFLSGDSARAAILGPTQQRFQDGEVVRGAMPPHFSEDSAEELVRQLVATPKVAGQPSYFVEPTELQVVCRGVWRAAAEAEAPQVTLEHLADGVEGALRGHYEAAIADTVERWRHNAWPDLTATSTDGLPPPATRRETRWTDVRWSRHARYTKRLRDFFGKRLVEDGENRSLVSERDPALKKIDPAALDWLRGFWRVLRRETRSGSEYLELSQDGFVKPVLESNRAYEKARQERASRYWAFLMVMLIPLVAFFAWSLGDPGDNPVRQIPIESITRFSDRPIRLAELYDDSAVTQREWDPPEGRAKLIVTLEEEIELVSIVVQPGTRGFSPQSVELGEGIGTDARLDVTARSNPLTPVDATYCCGDTLTLIVDLPESERSLNIAEIEIWGRSPTTNGSLQEP